MTSRPHRPDPLPRAAQWLEGRGVLVAALLLTVVAFPMSIAGVLQLADPRLGIGATVYLLVVCAVLHMASLVCHRFPVTAFTIGSLGMLALAIAVVPGLSSAAILPSAAAYLLLLWQMAATQGRRLGMAALAVGIAGAVIVTVVDWAVNSVDDPLLAVLEFASLAGGVSAAWAFGALTRQRRGARAASDAQRVRQAVADERTRIGRDLHDVVSHSLTVMIAQADAARVLVDEPQAARALDRVAETGRSAMQGLRGMLGVLDDGRKPHALDPAPDVQGIASLVASVATSDRRAGFAERGMPRPLLPDAELALYRGVQEALTNAVRHVLPPVRISVELTWRADQVVATVHDDGGAGIATATDGTGAGLIGMAERVRRAGGTLDVGREHGWTIRITIPTEAAG